MIILMPLPEQGFDPTESAIPWKVLTSLGHTIHFATPDGAPGRADDRMLTGRGLGPWAPILRARADARALYATMETSPEFQAPRVLEEVTAEDFDAIVLTGGHAPGMKSYLESEPLLALVADHMHANRPLGAICHGVVVVARATRDGVPVLRGRRTTALPESMERTAYHMTRLWLGRYYLTYDETVQAEVTRAVGPEGAFVLGPQSLLRDTPETLERGFTVRDGNYLSARWPGDAYRFSHEFHDLLQDNGEG
ncbi:MAG: hypothetical protein EA397_03705 [Deltaproteobacteria bacterium]|nr:MAG: hypothetical protein EA397_03705 [Deltaproteobacteria bacterium]